MPSDQPIDTVDFSTVFEMSMSDHWRLFQTEGAALVALGLAALPVVPLTGAAATSVIGWLFLTSGTLGLYSAFETHRAPGFGWSLLSASFALLAGGALLWNPWQGPATLANILIVFFNLDGVLLIMLALQLRHEAAPRWQWILASGIFDVALAEIIIAAMPNTATLGFFIGIDLVFAGVSMVAFANAAVDSGEIIKPVVTRELARRSRQSQRCFQP